MTLENKEGRQDGALEACNAEAAKHEASEQLNVFDKGRMEGPDADSTTHGTVRAVCVSKRKGMRKTVVDGPVTIEAHHASPRMRTPETGIAKFRFWLGIHREGPGARPRCEGRRFRREHHHRGINLMALPLGTQLKIGDDVLLELSQQGKVCHKKCAIFYLAGDCIFPREGIFFVTLTGGKVKAGDSIDVVKLGDGTCEYTPQEALDELANTPR